MHSTETTGSSNAANNVILRQRRFSRKTRTGCITCKIRRIKCDEAKPSCHRCTSTGRKCDGYSTVECHPRKLIQPHVPSPGGDAAEKNALYMFRTKIGALIASAFDAEFWTYDLLQSSNAYRPVQHAVAALAAAYQMSILSHCSDEGEKQFVICQYNKSINVLNQCINEGDLCTRKQQVVVLITNLIFICICAVQKSWSEACLHLKGGLSLLHEWKLGALDAVDESLITPTPLRHLLTVYTQLDTQARIVMRANDQYAGKVWSPHRVTLDGWGSGHFGAVTKAFSQLERLHNRVIQTTDLPRIMDRESDTYSQLVEGCLRDMTSWDSDFGALLHESVENSCYSRVLRLRRVVVGANLAVERRNANHTVGSDETWSKEVVSLAQEIVQDTVFQENGITFTPAGGLVEALWFVATRSAEKNIKLEAFNLLKQFPIIEGLWSSSKALEVVADTIGLRVE